MGARRYEDLAEILRDDWKELDGSLPLLVLVDSAKSTRTSTKRIKELMANCSEAELAAVLIMKTKNRNQRAYIDYKLRESDDDSKLSKEIRSLHSEKKFLLEQRSILINEILMYYECMNSAADSQ